MNFSPVDLRVELRECEGRETDYLLVLHEPVVSLPSISLPYRRLSYSSGLSAEDTIGEWRAFVSQIRTLSDSLVR